MGVLGAGILWWDSANQGIGGRDKFSVQTTAFGDFCTIFRQRKGDVRGDRMVFQAKLSAGYFMKARRHPYFSGSHFPLPRLSAKYAG